jgi:hypothetical protein
VLRRVQLDKCYVSAARDPEIKSVAKRSWLEIKGFKVCYPMDGLCKILYVHNTWKASGTN